MPVLGICYGAQLLAQSFGGSVQASSTREYGRTNLSSVNQQNLLFAGVDEHSQVWMSHGDTIVELPKNAERIAETTDVKNAAFSFKDELTFGIQFHPEVYHSAQGTLLLENFLKNICGCKQDWTSASFIESTVNDLKNKLGNDKVVLGLSGGVDSSVAAMLLHKAIGKKLHCIFVDNGLLRKGEFDQVLSSYEHLGLNVKGVSAADKFYDALKNISDPELKRKAIGKTFIEVFDEEAHLIKDVKWLAQGTIYPDVIGISKGPFSHYKIAS